MSVIPNRKLVLKWAEQWPNGAYFRVEEVVCAASITGDGDIIPGSGSVVLRARPYRILKVTPRGVRIDDYQNRATPGRVLLRDWTKQWASPTIDEAVKHFIARKRRQISIYEARIRNWEEAVRLAENEQINNGGLSDD